MQKEQTQEDMAEVAEEKKNAGKKEEREKKGREEAEKKKNAGATNIAATENAEAVTQRMRPVMQKSVMQMQVMQQGQQYGNVWVMSVATAAGGRRMRQRLQQ